MLVKDPGFLRRSFFICSSCRHMAATSNVGSNFRGIGQLCVQISLHTQPFLYQNFKNVGSFLNNPRMVWGPTMGTGGYLPEATVIQSYFVA
jgi:hypothetical protein